MKMVSVVEWSLVPPNEETPRHGIWLSNLDFNVSSYHVPLVYVYRWSGRVLPLEALKAALAGALARFYPIAGRLGVDRDGRTAIHCTGEGALFVVARSERTVDELGDFAPSPEMEMLVPSPLTPGYSPPILLMIQVTLFKCGGAAIGTAMHHAAADGHSNLGFVRHWCNVVRGVPELDVPPFFDRTVLRARSPPNPELFDRIRGSSHRTTTSVPKAPLASSVLKLSEDQVALIKEKASGRHSTSQAISAYTWRCACLARRLAPGQVTRLYLVVDVRTRMEPALPPGYFGNAICRTAAVATAGEIVSSPIEFGAKKMEDAINQVTDEYVRSVIDYIEVGGKGERRTDWDGFSGSDLIANSWLKLLTHADFGWGKPEFMGKTVYMGAGQVYIASDAAGGVSVRVTLEAENMKRFKRLFCQELEAIGGSSSKASTICKL